MNLTREEMGEHGFNGEDGFRPLLRPKKELHEPQVESTRHFRQVYNMSQCVNPLYFSHTVLLTIKGGFTIIYRRIMH